MTNKAFYQFAEQLALESHLDVEDVLHCVELAIVSACKSMEHIGVIEVEYKPEDYKIRIFEHLYVVDEVDPEGPQGQITLEQAKEIKQRVRVGSEIKTEILFADITRKGASRFKGVLNQTLKETQNKRTYEYFKENEGEMTRGHVVLVNREKGFVLLEIAKGQRVTIPLAETMPGESLEQGTPIQVYIQEVEETTKGPRIKVSRSHKALISRLFEQFIPEVSDGTIEVVSIARDPGNRTKIAVKSNSASVDPKGTCIGPQGTRIKQINDALGGEKIDIFNWSEDPIKLIAEALTPAKVISVLADEETHKSVVIVPDDQFTLAIGRGGQNVRLACQATGWKIDIKDETTAYREEIKFRPNVR